MMKSAWIGIGFSHHRVPSLSNTATRSSTGTSSATVRSTKSTIAFLAGPSIQLSSAGTGPGFVVMRCSPSTGSDDSDWQCGTNRPGSARPEKIAHAAEAEVSRGAADLLTLAGRGSVAQAVRRRAQVRPALDHPAGVLGQHRRLRGAAAVGSPGRSVPGVGPAGRRPLPDVARDVVEPVAVGGEPLDRRRPLEAVRAQVLPGKAAEPAVRHHPAAGLRIVAPGVDGLVEPAPGGVLPLRLGGQAAA